MLELFSCNKSTPSGFWLNFNKIFLKENISNQGAWGGHRAIYWKADKAKTFNVKETIDFAIKNGWKLVDSVNITTEDLNTWKDINKPIFPLSCEGFTKNATIKHSEYEYFPRWINAEAKVYMFKTGWIIIDPGTNESIDVNGFVLLSNEGNEMSVYHLWGE